MTLTAKEKACLHPDAEGHPVCLPEVCPYANGYYDRIKNALAALLDGSGQFSRAALADTARQFTVCPFELGLDLSEWCDVVIGDYNYLFDPVVHLKRFFDTSGDWLFLIDEAHNLPDRARAMYSARFCKSSLTDAKRTLGKGKSALKTALTKADKAMREARQACVRLAPRRHAEDAPGEPAQTSLMPESDAPAFALPEPLYAQDGTVFLQELPAALLGLFAGCVWDLHAAKSAGFNALFFMLLCFGVSAVMERYIRSTFVTVSYTHLTLPTKRIVEISGGLVSLKKKKA